MGATHQVYLSLGSNLQHRFRYLQKGVIAIAEKMGQVLKTSNVYENPAVGFEGDSFLNACILVETTLPPEKVLEIALQIERAHGRMREAHTTGYASRTLDIDVLLHDNLVLESETLTLPHPKMTERAFVLKPLADIAPQYYHPLLQKDIRNLLQECKDRVAVQKTNHQLFKSREHFFSQVQLIAIEGSIGAGKTSLAKMISEDFNAKLVLERFADNAFLPKFYEDPARFAFPLEMSFLADRYQQFSEDTAQFDLFKNFMVSDYDIFKSLIFAQITLQKDEFKLYRKLFNFMYKEIKKPDIYLFLYQNTDRLLENIKTRGRTYEQNIEAQYLEKINRGYLDFLKEHPQQNSIVLDLSELDFIKHPEDYTFILEQLEDNLLKKAF
ncbi:MAG: 2-amino-4-hydroxy-6-hydroxymethyldihydropteridine diphosphokinase [Bacteroidota bacterium]